MNRVTEVKLIEFCFTQHSHFAAKAWLQQLEYADREELALVAQFLSNLSWYGSRQELIQTAQQLSPGIEERLPRLIRDKRFDCGRFSATLRKRIEKR